MPVELRLELDTLPGDEVFGDELLRLVYGLERSGGSIMRGDSIRRQSDNALLFVQFLSDACLFRPDILHDPEASLAFGYRASYRPSERDAPPAPSTLPYSSFLHAVVDTAELACEQGWLEETALTRMQTHRVTREQNIAALIDPLSKIIVRGRCRLQHRQAPPVETARDFATLYDTDATCGLKDMYLPDKEDLLLTLTASYHSRVAEIYDDLLGAGLERTAAGYFASRRTTLFPEAALESVREAVNEWPIFFKIPGPQVDRKARERIEEHVEQLVLRTMGRMSGTDSYLELMSQVQDTTGRLTRDGADDDTLARDLRLVKRMAADKTLFEEGLRDFRSMGQDEYEQ